MSATINWGSFSLADETRVKLSPIGLTHVPGVGGSRPAASSCRWWPLGAGEPGLCAARVEGTASYARLRAAYPLLSVAMWAAVISLFLQVLNLPRGPGLRVAITWSVALLSAVAVVFVRLDAGRGLEVLAGRPESFGAPGFWLAIAGVILAIASSILQH